LENGLVGPRRDEVTGKWKRLHNDMHKQCSSGNILVIKSRSGRYAGLVALQGKGKYT
jgi:hypothetical protein